MNERQLNKAIKYLRPTAQFSFTDNDYSTIKWDVLDGNAPTQKEIDAAIEQVEKIYADANLPAVFHLITPIYQEFADYLIDKGWKEKVGAAFMVCDITNMSV
mgnify:CR=1 FL=1